MRDRLYWRVVALERLKSLSCMHLISSGMRFAVRGSVLVISDNNLENEFSHTRKTFATLQVQGNVLSLDFGCYSGCCLNKYPSGHACHQRMAIPTLLVHQRWQEACEFSLYCWQKLNYACLHIIPVQVQSAPRAWTQAGSLLGWEDRRTQSKEGQGKSERPSPTWVSPFNNKRKIVLMWTLGVENLWHCYLSLIRY